MKRKLRERGRGRGKVHAQKPEQKMDFGKMRPIVDSLDSNPLQSEFASKPTVKARKAMPMFHSTLTLLNLTAIAFSLHSSGLMLSLAEEV